MKKIIEALPNFNIMEHKALGIYFISLAISIFIMSYITSSLIISYNDNVNAKTEIAKMEGFLKDYTNKFDTVNNSQLRPILNSQLDAVQSELLFKLQTYQLNLVSMQEQKRSQEKNGHIYAMEFEGPYVNTIQFLSTFNIRNTLIGIKQLSIEQQNNLIKTKLTYKIYTKDEPPKQDAKG